MTGRDITLHEVESITVRPLEALVAINISQPRVHWGWRRRAKCESCDENKGGWRDIDIRGVTRLSYDYEHQIT